MVAASTGFGHLILNEKLTVHGNNAQRSHQMQKQQQDMRKIIANMERTRKNGPRNMFFIVGGYQGVAKIARDRTRTEQQKPSNIPQKKGNHQIHHRKRKPSNIPQKKETIN